MTLFVVFVSHQQHAGVVVSGRPAKVTFGLGAVEYAGFICYQVLFWIHYWFIYPIQYIKYCLDREGWCGYQYGFTFGGLYQRFQQFVDCWRVAGSQIVIFVGKICLHRGQTRQRTISHRNKLIVVLAVANGGHR